MVFPVWLAGLLLSLIAAEVFVRIARWQVAQPLREKRPSIFSLLPFSLFVTLLCGGALLLATYTLKGDAHALTVLAPVVALWGWCACWARSLERCVDDAYPNRVLSTMDLRETSIVPFGVLLIGIYKISPFKSLLETLLLGAILAPLYFLYTTALTKRAYPAVPLDRTAVMSKAFQFGAWLFPIGLVCWLLGSYVPLFRHYELWMGVCFTFYLAGTWFEIDLAHQFTKGHKPIEPEVTTPVLPAIATATTETSEETQIISRKH